MKILIDTDAKILKIIKEDERKEIPLYSKEAFEIISRQWLKIGWNQKYTYTFTWMGRPIIQLPEDIVRIQEAIYRVNPDIIIETGVAHGGSLIFYASLCEMMKKGRVIGIDIEIRPHNRKAIETHEMFSRITLIEGSSISLQVLNHIKSIVKSEETVLVILDSCHTKQHVIDELEAYHDLVTIGSYIVATDGIMKDFHDIPRGKPEWIWDNPATAVGEFLQKHSEFVLEQPPWPFNESELTENITYWHSAWLKRIK